MRNGVVTIRGVVMTDEAKKAVKEIANRQQAKVDVQLTSAETLEREKEMSLQP